MIEPDTSVGIISAVGFPIAMCLILVYERFQDRKTDRDTTREVIKANTAAMVEMTTLIKERLK